MKSNSERNYSWQIVLLAILLTATACLLFAAVGLCKMSPLLIAWCAAAGLVCHIYSRLSAMSSPSPPSLHCFVENSASSIAALAIAFFPAAAFIFIPILVLAVVLLRLFNNHFLNLSLRELFFAGLTASILLIIFTLYMVLKAGIGIAPLRLSLLGFNSTGPLPLWALPAILVPAAAMYVAGLLAGPELRLLSCGRDHFEGAGLPYTPVNTAAQILLGVLSAFSFVLSGWAACLGTALPLKKNSGLINEPLSLLACFSAVFATALLAPIVHPIIMAAAILAIAAASNIFQMIKESPLHD